MRNVLAGLDQELQEDAFRIEYGGELGKLDFALSLIQARSRSCLTQHQLAENLGVSQSHISNLESGHANPTVEKVGRVFASMWLRPNWGAQTLGQDPAISPPITSEAPMSGGLFAQSVDELRATINNVLEGLKEQRQTKQFAISLESLRIRSVKVNTSKAHASILQATADVTQE